MRMKRYPRNENWLLMVSEISFCAFIVLALFIVKQLMIIANWKTRIYSLYSSVYYWLIVIIPLLCVLYILADAIHPIASVRSKLYGMIKKWEILFVMINVCIACIVILATINTILMLLYGPIQHDKPAEITILYDSGTLHKLVVQELATPLIFEMGLSKNKTALLPLEEKNLGDSLNEAKYLIVLSHGEGGKVYSTNPLTPYTFDQFGKYMKGQLKLVYFSACYLGSNGYAKRWEEVMAPARTILYSRESAILEHVVWLVFRARHAIMESGW